jgi:hypothetical protein
MPFALLRVLAFCALALSALAPRPAPAQATLTTAESDIVFLANGAPRARFGTAYIPDGGSDGARLRTELGYAGVPFAAYRTLSDATLRDMLADTDFVAALPVNILAQPFAERFFVRPHFAFVAGPEGLEPVRIERADGAAIEAVDLGVLADAPPGVARAADGLTTLLALRDPLPARPVTIRRYAMTMPEGWLSQRLDWAGAGLAGMTEVAADGLAAAVAAPDEAVIFLSQNQNHPTLAPVFDPAAGARYYAATNFGIVPVRPEAAPADLVPAEPETTEAEPEPAETVARAPAAPAAEIPAEAAPAAVEEAAPAEPAGPPPPWFDLTSAEMYVVIAANRAELDAMRGVYLPRTLNLFATEDGKTQVVRRKAAVFMSTIDAARRRRAVARYVDWLSADRGDEGYGFSKWDRIDLIDGAVMSPSGHRYVALPAVLSSQLVRPEAAPLRDADGAAFAILDRHGLTPIRPTVGAPASGETIRIAPQHDEAFADAHRIARSEAAGRAAPVVVPRGKPVTGVATFGHRSNFIDLSEPPFNLTGAPRTQPAPLADPDDYAPDAQARILEESGMALLFGRGEALDDPMLDRLFDGSHAFFEWGGAEIAMPPFPADALRPYSRFAPEEVAFCGVESGPLVVGAAPLREGQGSQLMVAASDLRAVGLAQRRELHRGGVYVLPDARITRDLVASPRNNVVFSSPGAAAALLGPDLDCARVVATPF